MAREAIRKHEIVQILLKEIIPGMVYDPQHPISTAARKLKKTIVEEHTESSEKRSGSFLK